MALSLQYQLHYAATYCRSLYTTTMRLYAFGSNGSGQLGIGSTYDTNIPKVCPLPDHLPSVPKSIVAGGNHTLLLFNDGTVFYSGSSRDGSVQSEFAPSATHTFQRAYISTLTKDVKLCSAWWDGSVFVDTSDSVYTAGPGSKGEQGTKGPPNSFGLQKLQKFPPTETQQIGTIVDVNSGVDHTVVVLADGTVWGWGNGRKGQLTGSRATAWSPRRFEQSKQSVARAVCGRDFTFLMYKNGTHEVLDTNKWGLQEDAPEPTSDWKDVSASWGSIFILKEDGKVESWGRNDHGQLAPPGLPDIEQLAVGSEHVVALTKGGRVVSWGWGEHGNCGVDTDENGDVKGKWNEIPVDQSDIVLGVGAGCATSFFWTKTLATPIERLDTDMG